jgi:hypothetical protein
MTRTRNTLTGVEWWVGFHRHKRGICRMGVDRTDYLMIAVDVGYDAFDWDRHEKEAEGAPGAKFDIVVDGMSGKYCLAGKIIAVSEPYEGFNMSSEIESDALAVDRGQLAADVAEAFPHANIRAESFKMILFSHFF